MKSQKKQVMLVSAGLNRIDVTLPAIENDDYSRALAKMYRAAAELIERTETTVACPPYVAQNALAVCVELSEGELLEEALQAVLRALKESGYKPEVQS